MSLEWNKPTSLGKIDKLAYMNSRAKIRTSINFVKIKQKGLKQHDYRLKALRNKISGSMLFNQNFTEDTFVNLLENIIAPLIVQVLQDQIDGETHLDVKPLHTGWCSTPLRLA